MSPWAWQESPRTARGDEGTTSDDDRGGGGDRVSTTRAGAVIHRNVAVIACDTSGTLRETLHRLEDLDIDAVRVGDRHLVLPASQVNEVLAKMREHGQFPRLIGDPEPGIEEATVDAPEAAAEDE